MALLVGDLVGGENPRAALAERLGVVPDDILEMSLVRRALDARQRVPVWRENWRVVVVGEAGVLGRKPKNTRLFTDRDAQKLSGVVEAPSIQVQGVLPVVVVGAGPAGLFAALRLGEAGVPTILLDRGGAVEARVPSVNRFWRGGSLDEENNLLFGEGGAGTFSDGKIYTRRRDGELGYIFRVLVEAGADSSIITESYPHLGTDKVRAILPALRDRLLRQGVEVRYGCKVVGFHVVSGRCSGVILSDGSFIKARAVIAAPGHSARDTLRALLEAGAEADVRPIAIGARVEHPQSVIDAARYPQGRGDLPPASYRLAHSPKSGRAGWTFCMCPGGMVVPAMNGANTVVVNGMSFAARRALWANSAVIVQVKPEDYDGLDPLAGFRFQDMIERRAFDATQSYSAPAQRVEDFLLDRVSSDLPRSSYPMGIKSVPLSEILPRPIIHGMKEALRTFNKDIPGFSGPEGVLIAPESRTTAPLRFRRSASLESTVLGLFPVGEGAGYAGGIISAALDGFRAAQALLGLKVDWSLTL